MTNEFIRNYQGFIWTDHALHQIKMRKLSQADVVAVMRGPEKTYPGKKDSTVKFIRKIDGRCIHVIGKLLVEKKQWLILSAWVRGEEDPKGLVTRLVEWVVDKIIVRK